MRTLLLQQLAAGTSLEELCSRTGLPLRRVQEVAEARPSQLTPAQHHTLLHKLHHALATPKEAPEGRPPA